MNISLTPELEKYIDKQLKSGLYHSASEVMRAALRLLIDSDTQSSDYENYKMWLRQEVQIGLDQAKRGELIPGDEAMRDFRKFRKEQMSKNDKNE